MDDTGWDSYHRIWIIAKQEMAKAGKEFTWKSLLEVYQPLGFVYHFFFKFITIF